ncbi:MAG: tRNA (adenosine(37)-N6)-threonylcarbamoyltransferase complex dimerization subunit type 1 TsaB [Acutalibacter sp.]|nr:tRNA (adenosine(37)-N6)-threonylcarbamoyltransferase complex dimerization subunit type 1 TsaB [Acutalibacter sp.]
MLILAIESSASPASAAVLEDGKLLGETFVNTKQTHSQTLLPMVQNLMNSLGKTCADFDVMAVTNGPGSFTGVRIGVSCVKGLAMTNDTPCCGVSTLEAIAMPGRTYEGCIICAVMDARCGQVYNALFQVTGGTLHRLTSDRALSIAELSQECESYQDRLVLFGDGAVLCYEAFQAWGAQIAPPELRFQRASSVALLALESAKTGKTVTVQALMPSYLRLPQAERELKKRQKKGEKGT